MPKIAPREGPSPFTTPFAPRTQISQNLDAATFRAFRDRAFYSPLSSASLRGSRFRGPRRSVSNTGTDVNAARRS